MLSFIFQKLRTVKGSHDQVLNEMERLNHQLKEEQNKSLTMQNELKTGTANQRRVVEVSQIAGKRLHQGLRKVKKENTILTDWSQ